MRYTLIFIVMCFLSCKNDSKKNTSIPTQETKERITESEYIDLGGEEQYVETIYTTKDNPILLFIHGGPAWPQTPQLRYYSSELADTYTLVIWEQRGAGNSYKRNPNPQNVSLAQIVSDGHQLTQVLKKKYKRDKIYLAGYSWGSIVGVELAENHPSDYMAYIGIAQLINMEEGMAISRSWLKDKASAAQSKADLLSIDSLSDLSLFESRHDRFFAQWRLLNKYHGATTNTESEKETEKAMAMYDDYSDYNWFAVWEKSSVLLQGDMYDANINEVNSLDLPIILLQGRNDWNIPSILADVWLTRLKAPQKEIFWFENSGHGPLEEEFEKFNQVMHKIPSLIDSQ